MTVTFRYDPDVDAGYITVGQGPIDRTVDLGQTELALPVLIDLDAAGALVGIEILEVSKTAPSLR